MLLYTLNLFGQTHKGVCDVIINNTDNNVLHNTYIL